MEHDQRSNESTSRRDFLRTAGGAALGLGAGVASGAAVTSSATTRAGAAKASAAGPYNILFILTDQERFFRPGELPVGYSLPAHERLKKQGTTFVNHRINSCVCTPSRSVLYTGQHIQQTRDVRQHQLPLDQEPVARRPNPGRPAARRRLLHRLQGQVAPDQGVRDGQHARRRRREIFTKEMEAYGFSDYFGIGDIIAHTQGGYLHDGVIAAMGASWLRGKGRDAGGRWQAVVPRREPREPARRDVLRHRCAGNASFRPQRGLAHLARDPVDPLYAKQWEFALPASHFQRIDAPGPPGRRITTSFARTMRWPARSRTRKPRWRRRHNYYLNCLRDVDRNIATVLAELDAAGLADRTIVDPHRGSWRHGRCASAPRQGSRRRIESRTTCR